MSEDAPQTPVPQTASAPSTDEPSAAASAATPAPGPVPAVDPVTAETHTTPVQDPLPLTVEPPPFTAEPPAPAVTASGLPNPLGLPEIAVDRPEVAVGAAFGGGLVLALILKRLAR